MWNRRFLWPLFIVALVWDASLLVGYVKGQEQVSDVLAKAEVDMASAYKAVLTAESNGGDIRGLVEELNVACSFLAEAKNLFGDRSSDLAFDRALQSSEISTKVELEAEALATKAAQDSEATLRIQMVVSLFAVGMVVVVGYGAWVRFKRFYLLKVLGMRPEGAHDEP